MNIIDIRSSREYNMGHIKGSVNIVATKLLAFPSTYLNKNETYYIYCKTGVTSEKLSQILNKMGYNIINLGSYNSLKETDV